MRLVVGVAPLRPRRAGAMLPLGRWVAAIVAVAGVHSCCRGAATHNCCRIAWRALNCAFQ